MRAKTLRNILVSIIFLATPLSSYAYREYNYKFLVDGQKITISIYEDRWGSYIPGNDNSASIGWDTYYGAYLVYLYSYYIMEWVVDTAKAKGISVTNNFYAMGFELESHALAYMGGVKRDEANPADIELNY